MAMNVAMAARPPGLGLSRKSDPVAILASLRAVQAHPAKAAPTPAVPDPGAVPHDFGEGL